MDFCMIMIVEFIEAYLPCLYWNSDPDFLSVPKKYLNVLLNSNMSELNNLNKISNMNVVVV